MYRIKQFLSNLGALRQQLLTNNYLIRKAPSTGTANYIEIASSLEKGI
jgi:hypothetical protein